MLISPSEATTIDRHAAERTLATADAVVEGTVVGTRETMLEEGLPMVYHRIEVWDVLGLVEIRLQVPSSLPGQSDSSTTLLHSCRPP